MSSTAVKTLQNINFKTSSELKSFLVTWSSLPSTWSIFLLKSRQFRYYYYFKKILTNVQLLMGLHKTLRVRLVKPRINNDRGGWGFDEIRFATCCETFFQRECSECCECRRRTNLQFVLVSLGTIKKPQFVRI